MQLVDFKQNWRLYATVMLGLGLGVADRFEVTIPGWAMWIINRLGNVPLRDSIRAKAKESADDIVRLVEDILAQVAIPEAAKADPQTGLTGAVVKTIPVEVKELPKL